MATSGSGVTPEAELTQRKTREDRYRLGQYFTPEPVANFMATHIIGDGAKSVLDPAVGGGVLLRAIGDGAKRYGIDIDDDAVGLARASMEPSRLPVEVEQGDFLDRDRWPFSAETFDAIIANPPYIRHHNLSAEHKALATQYSREFNARVSTLSGSYIYFFLEAIRRLREGGRLVFITPTEFLDVRYGTAVKQVLLRHCEIDDILVLQQDELAFDGVLTTSAITICTKTAVPRRAIRLTEATADHSGVKRGASVELPRELARPELPWTALLPTRAARLRPLMESRPHRLGDYARVRRGIATGDNSFFCLTQAEVDEHGIEPRFLVPAVLGARDIPTKGPLTKELWQSGLEAGRRGWLLWCHLPKADLSGTNVLRYIEEGEGRGLHERFNCRSRKPWYGVERVDPPDYFVTYMARDSARFVRNKAGARCMTSLLNLWAKPPVTADDLDRVLHDPVNAVLLREFGRTYGGGLGKIEPGDLVELPVPEIHTTLDSDGLGQVTMGLAT